MIADNMEFDPTFIDAIKGFEGYSSKPFWDFKQWTSGYGTKAAGPHEEIDHATAEQRLRDELAKAAAHVDAMGVQNMPAGARNALISLTYNAGSGWMQHGLGDLVRQRDWPAAAERLREYCRAGGCVNEGLAKRRAVEASWII
jgi:lysozyme